MTPRPIDLRPDPDAARERTLVSFYRACALTARRVLDPTRGGMDDYVARQGWADDRIAALITRAAVSPAMTSTSGWAKELGRSIVADFLAALAPVSAAGEL